MRDHHVVYRIADLEHPRPEKLFQTSGQYDGIAFSSDHKALYVSNWNPAGLIRIDLQTGQATPLVLDFKHRSLVRQIYQSVKENLYSRFAEQSRSCGRRISTATAAKGKNYRLSSHILDITRESRHRE